MNPALAYFLGAATGPAICAAAFAYIAATDTGLQIECAVCRYDTGDMDTTRRLTCWTRWRWHQVTTGHHTPWGPPR